MNLMSKIVDLTALGPVLKEHRAQGRTIVHSHGVFDLLHIGHIKHFQQAKKFGDILVVTLTADQFVKKGPNRPAFTESLRAEALAALECVDYVAINFAESAVPAIEEIQPKFYVKGPDYKERSPESPGKLSLEEQAVRQVGGALVFTEDITFSSSTLINRHFPPFSPDVQNYLLNFRKRHSLRDVLKAIDDAQDLRVLIVGETIIDDYHYVEAIGKAGKEPVLVTRSQSSEQFAGGSIAIANHVAGFCREVALLTCLGTENSYESFVREHLKPSIKPCFLRQDGRPTIVKLRYLDHYLMQKLFEVYFIDDEEMSSDEESSLLESLEELLPKYDAVIVADYGHGMLGKKAIELLCSKAKFLAINTQANAGNRGLHTVSRYPRADYISLSEGELRLEIRTREGDVRQLVNQLKTRMDCPLITVTRGKHGIMCFQGLDTVAEAPGLTQSFIDRVGSGDAVLATTSPLAALGVDPEVLALVGNIAGSEAVKTVGHRNSLDFHSFKRMVSSLLK
jgi:rfaE bifunctional protein kinase chain/domain/rfaE bifunctional protein nucleotidyltransferase chain/domain